MADTNKISFSPVWALVVLLVGVVGAAFVIGVLWTKVQTPEEGKKGTDVAAPTQDVSPTAVVLSDSQMAELVDGGHILGSPEAPVTIVEFADFQCPYCARYAIDDFPQINEEYIETGQTRYVFRHYPLTFHQNAQKAAEAAECAGEQDMFWEMHDEIYANQENITVADLKGYAVGLGLNTSDFDSCLDSEAKKDVVQSDFNLGETVGVAGTPTIFVNGRKVEWANNSEGWFNAVKRYIEAV